jgi:hypothetical protein
LYATAKIEPAASPPAATPTIFCASNPPPASLIHASSATKPGM